MAAAGTGLLSLSVAACGAEGSKSGDSAEGNSKPAAATVLPIDSTVRSATWTDRSATHSLKVAPERLARGTAADLDHVRLDDDLKGMVPYYLTITYTNTGSAPLAQPDPESHFTVTLADGTPGRAVTLWNTNTLATASSRPLPDDCGAAGPASVAAKATATVCQLVMLPKGRTPVTVAYADEAGATLLWKVGDGEGDDNDGRLLAARTSAESSYKDVTTKGDAVPLRVTPKSVEAGRLKDLGDYDLGSTSKRLVPWYVTLQYRNLGKEKLLPVMDDGVGLRTAGGREVQPVPLIDFSGAGEGEGIDQCRGSVPHTRLAPGSTLTLCTIHLLPEGDRPAMVSFQGEGNGVRTLTWRAD
ncbi:hypothetical protein GCM10027075_46810 [Streptomyces heilongjiangensis]